MNRLQKRNFIFFCIVCIFISSRFTFNLSTSRYMGQITAEENILAIPILTLTNNTQGYTVTNMLPGDEQEFEFSVSNVDGEQTNEVLLSYYFKINMETEIPLEVKIYDISESEEKELQITNNETEKMQMNIVEKETDKITKNYRLKITWNAQNNSYEYAGKTIACIITLEGVQMN